MRGNAMIPRFNWAVFVHFGQAECPLRYRYIYRYTYLLFHIFASTQSLSLSLFLWWIFVVRPQWLVEAQLRAQLVSKGIVQIFELLYCSGESVLCVWHMGKPVQIRSDKPQLVLEVGRCRARKKWRATGRERMGEQQSKRRAMILWTGRKPNALRFHQTLLQMQHQK